MTLITEKRHKHNQISKEDSKKLSHLYNIMEQQIIKTTFMETLLQLCFIQGVVLSIISGCG